MNTKKKTVSIELSINQPKCHLVNVLKTIENAVVQVNGYVDAKALIFGG